jgi:hypothetical protein
VVMNRVEFDPKSLTRLFEGADAVDTEIDESEVVKFFEHPEMLSEIQGSVDRLGFLAKVMSHLIDCESCMKKAKETLEDKNSKMNK